jgi:hypothetical protein
LGELAALFHDRGVAPASLVPDSFWIGSNGGVRLTTTERVDYALDVSPCTARCVWSAALGASGSEPFSAGFGRGLALDSDDQHELAQLPRAD